MEAIEVVPVVVTDKATGLSREFKDPRAVILHRYSCPICSTIIDACHDSALLADSLIKWENTDPCATQPPLPETGDFDLVG
jgi:hypothetical protein